MSSLEGYATELGGVGWFALSTRSCCTRAQMGCGERPYHRKPEGKEIRFLFLFIVP